MLDPVRLDVPERTVAEMTSVPTETWGLVFWKQDRHQFAVGTSLRAVSPSALVDSRMTLPDVNRRRFRLDGGRWETPGADDAEALVGRLIRHGAVVRDPMVTGVLRGDPPAVTCRALERRFRAATGLTQGAVRQIQRARTAAVLLSSGEAVSDVAGTLGFYDEPHLSRALRRYVGRTARELREGVGGALALDPAQRTTS
jgi:hypothetical protein